MAFIEGVQACVEWLKGKKTYIMILVGAVDQIGVTQGYWDEGRLREIAEATLGFIFLRMGVKESGPK